jgi:NACalpha-BTF3-like transcription factor
MFDKLESDKTGEQIDERLKQPIFALDKAAREVLKTFGVGSERIQDIKNGLADAVTEVTKLGGNFDNIKNMQIDISKNLGRNIILNSDLYKDLYAASKVTERDASDIVSKFRDIGQSSFDAVKGMEKVVEVSTKSGVNAKNVSDQVLSNMEKMNKFNFQGGVQGLAKMAAQAVSLRVDMSKTLDIADKLFEPENAIELAASMQRLGVAQSDLLDPLRLMDLAQNDPAELQNQIVKMSQQFVQLNKDGKFEIMPGARRQLKEISKDLGMNYEDLTRMALGSSDLNKKMSEIKFPKDAVTEEQREMIANMSEMGKGGKYEISVGGQTKSVSELSKEDIELLSKQPKTLEEIQKDQLSVLETIAKNTEAVFKGPQFALARTTSVTKTFEKAKEKSQKLGKELTPEFMQPKALSEFLDKNFEIFSNKLEGGLKEIFGDSGIEKFNSLIKDSNPELEKFKENLKNIITTQQGFSFLPQKKESLPIPSESNNNNTESNRLPIPSKTNNNTESKPLPIPAKDFIIKTLPEDKIVVAGGTNIDNKKNESTFNESKNTVDVNLNITTSIDVNKMFENLNFNKESLKQEIMNVINKTVQDSVIANNKTNNNPYVIPMG